MGGSGVGPAGTESIAMLGAAARPLLDEGREEGLVEPLMGAEGGVDDPGSLRDMPSAQQQVDLIEEREVAVERLDVARHEDEEGLATLPRGQRDERFEGSVGRLRHRV